MNLTLDDHRIDDVAAVIDSHKPAHFNLTRTFVDVDDADVAAEWIGQVWRIVVIDRFESGLHARRMIRVSCERDLLNRLRAIRRPFDEELARFPLEIVL